MIEPNNSSICAITYHIVERITGWFEQTTKRTTHHIHLYADSVSTAKNVFKLEHIHDMSYKPFSSGSGLFYLHTNQGVFMFEIEVDPTHFIQTYKKIRS